MLGSANGNFSEPGGEGISRNWKFGDDDIRKTAGERGMENDEKRKGGKRYVFLVGGAAGRSITKSQCRRGRRITASLERGKKSSWEGEMKERR